MTPLPRYAAVATGERKGTIRLPDVAAIAAFAGIYSYAVYYFFNNGVAYLQPNFVYAAVYVAGAFAYIVSDAARRTLARNTAILGLWTLLIVLMSIQYLAFEIVAQGTNLYTGRMHFLATLAATLAILGASDNHERIIWALAWVVIGCSALNVFEFFLAGSIIEWMSNVPGRAAGFYENANDSAMFICLAVPLIALHLGTTLRVTFYLIALVGVYLTFSRGGLALFVLLVSLTELTLSTAKPGWAVRALILAALGFSVVVMLSFADGDLSRAISDALWPYLDANTAARIEFLSNDSTKERILLLERGLQGFVEAPLFGHGIGYTYAWEASASTHNLFVLMLAEMGLVGGAWLLAFLFVLWTCRRPYGGLMVASVSMSALFSHNHLERPALAMLLGLYLITAQRKALWRQRAKA